MSHTPGPWKTVPREYDAKWMPPEGERHVLGIWGPNDEEIVITDSGYYPPSIADAALIVAAPDLLAALEVSRGQWIHSVNAAQCLAAIEKAKGR